MSSNTNIEAAQIVAEAEMKLTRLFKRPVCVTYFKPVSYTANDVITAIQEVTDISYDQMLKKDRTRDIVAARHLYFYFMRARKNQIKATVLASEFDTDHSTVLRGVRQIQDLLLAKDDYITHYVSEIKKRINA